jgi:DNA-binding SARP family transcriptional activator/ABC-type branched-subunit amino acid transport system substrate-binding protein
MARLTFAVLGPLAVQRDGAPLPLGTGKRALLLALLLVESGRAVSRDRLIDELWGEQPPETAVTALHGLVSQLRKLLESEAAGRSGSWEVIVGRGSGYGIELPDGALDAQRFSRLLARSRAARDAGDHGEALSAVDEALALWRGRPLLGFSTPAIEGFAQRCEAMRLDALEDRGDALLGLGRPQEALAVVEPLIEHERLRERLCAIQAAALYRCGRQVDALQALAGARRRLREEFGLAPSPTLDDLERRILNHDPELAPAGPPPDARRRRRSTPRVLAGAGALLAAGAVAVAIAVTRGGDSAGPSASGMSDHAVAIDAATGRVVASYPVGAGAVGVAAAAGTVWTLNTDDRTVTRIDVAAHSTRTLGTGTIPIDLAAGEGALWTANGSRTDAQFVGPVATAVSKLDPASGTTILTTGLRLSRTVTSNEGRQHIVAIHAGVFVVGSDFAISRLTAAAGLITARTAGVRATAVAYGPLGLWALEPTGLVHVDQRSLRVLERVPLASTNLDRLAVGARSLWITDSAAGTLWRVDVQGAQPTARTISLEPGVDAVTVSSGAVWVTNPERHEIVRVDPARNAVSARIRLAGPPLGLAAAGRRVWVTVGSSPEAGDDPLAASCGPVIYGGSGQPQRLIVSDFPMGAGPRLPAREMADAIAFVLRARHFRAGGYSVGYRACDDWSGATDVYDPAKCRANGRAYARVPAILAVIGPYNSGCALELIPAANGARGGPLPVVSPTATQTELTRPGVTAPPGLPGALYPSRIRSFVRLLATDDDEGAALAGEAAALGARRVDVVKTGALGETASRAFLLAAARRGLRVGGVHAYDPAATEYAALARTVARDRPEAVVVAGLLDEGAGAVIAALRARLGARVELIGSSSLLPVSALFARAGPAARGVHVSLSGYAADGFGPGGRAFVRAFGADRQAPVQQATIYAAAAAGLALDAIARSGGTRSGTLSALRRTTANAILGPLRFDPNGDVRPRVVTIVRAMRGGGSSALQSVDGAVVERVIAS